MGLESPGVEWLTGLMLGMASAIPEAPELSLKVKGTVTGPKGAYEIRVNREGKPLAKAGHYTLYVAQLPSGKYGLMKIANEVKFNSLLETEIRVLQEMQDAGMLTAPYDFGMFFPEVIDQFLSGDGRQVIILGYTELIKSFKQLEPLARILTPLDEAGKPKPQRFDLKTATWVMGKMFKVLRFAHDLGYANNAISAYNVLIEPELHGVFVLDWSRATVYANEVPLDISRQEVAKAAEMVWKCAGGTLSEEPPHDSHLMSPEAHKLYVQWLRKLMSGTFDDPRLERAELYRMADENWPPQPTRDGGSKRDFHEFHTFDL